ncbi:hypothetical protein [Kitasatospora sp. GP82]|uniref:hypothetical protein n=1 Tax=Kitasatospora sp. GP82 TaxID=3035089 RepID=UPI0024733D85|nr:hypothetical protein [Kitasatospora sp. GP82]MDH6130284.1 hypothetical protein [Kitasatospora sp. GP82]
MPVEDLDPRAQDDEACGVGLHLDELGEGRDERRSGGVGREGGGGGLQPLVGSGEGVAGPGFLFLDVLGAGFEQDPLDQVAGALGPVPGFGDAAGADRDNADVVAVRSCLAVSEWAAEPA